MYDYRWGIIRLSYVNRTIIVLVLYDYRIQTAPAKQHLRFGRKDKMHKKTNNASGAKARSPALDTNPQRDTFETAACSKFRFGSRCTPAHETNTPATAQRAPHVNNTNLCGGKGPRAALARKRKLGEVSQ